MVCHGPLQIRLFGLVQDPGERTAATGVQTGECPSPTVLLRPVSEAPSDLADRENEIFERVVRPDGDVESDAQKFVVIDVETEDDEIDTNARAAFDRLLERHPDARGRTCFAGWDVTRHIISAVDSKRQATSNYRII